MEQNPLDLDQGSSRVRHPETLGVLKLAGDELRQKLEETSSPVGWASSPEDRGPGTSTGRREEGRVVVSQVRKVLAGHVLEGRTGSLADAHRLYGWKS